MTLPGPREKPRLVVVRGRSAPDARVMMAVGLVLVLCGLALLWVGL